MFFFRIARFFLFLLPAETAHYFTMRLLNLPFGTSIFPGVTKNEDKLAKEIAGIKFPNPIGLAAGFDKNARWIPILAKLGFGHIEIGTVTPKPQPGNPKPRLFRLPKDKALVNRMGFNNNGADVIADRLKNLDRSKLNVVIGGNIGKNKITPNEEAVNDYLICFEKLFDFVDYFVVNVSSPNTPGLRELQEKESLAGILSSVQKANQAKSAPKPLFLKISPDLHYDQIDEIIEVVKETRLTGIIATNTTISRDGLRTDLDTVEQAGNGGLSGAPLAMASHGILWYLRSKCPKDMVLISSGGLMQANQAKKRLDEGADLIQIYTGFIYEGRDSTRESKNFFYRKRTDDQGMATDQKIKICHLTSVHRANDTRIFYKECRSLAKYFETVLIAPASKNEVKDGVQIIAVKIPGNRLQRFLFTDWAIFFKSLRTSAVIYHIHDPELIVQGLLLKVLGKKIIYDIEEDVRADIQEKEWLFSKAIFRYLFLFFEKLAVKYFYLVLAESSYSNIYKNRTSNYIVVQNFVPIDAVKSFNPSLSQKRDTLALIGTLSARRALSYILDAIYILQQKGILVKLKCIGPRDQTVEDILKASSAWPNIKDQIDFKGYIPFPDCLFECGDCFAGLALPETLPNHIHSYPTKMFEYMSIGLPVIASNFPLYKEIIEKYDCGLTVTPESGEEIAEAILYLYSHPENAERMGQNAKAAARNFDWKTEEENLLDFYKLIID